MNDISKRDAPAEHDGSAGFGAHWPDIAVAAVVLAICVFLFVNTYYFDRVPASLAQNVQPSLFPRIVLIVIALLALLLPFEHRRKLRHGIDLDEERNDRIALIVPVTALALVVFVAAVPWLGALPALVLIAAILPLLWGERRWMIFVPYVILFPPAVYFLFSELLQVNFPRGAIQGLLG